MRGRVEELEERLGKELVIFVNGIRVAFPVEFDTDEGWCIALEYRLPGVNRAQKITAREALHEAKSGAQEFGLQQLEPVEIKINGKVQVAYWEAEEDATTP